MLIGHSRPANVTWSINGTGASIDSSTEELDDGRPSTTTAFTWISGIQNTSSRTNIRAEWTGAIVPRVVGISNTDLPAGTKVVVKFRRASDTVGTYPYAAVGYVSQQRIVEGPRGERTAWFVFQDSSSSVVGCEVELWNDVNGVASIVASSSFHIGEILIGSGDDTCPTMGAGIEEIDPTTAQWTWENQPYVTPGLPYRQMTINFRNASEAVWFSTYIPLMAKMNRGQSCAYILRYKDLNGNFSADLLHSYAFIGIATKLARMGHRARDRFDSGPISITEAPVPI